MLLLQYDGDPGGKHERFGRRRLVIHNMLTANVMHPIPARFDGKNNRSTEERAEKLADFMTGLGVSVILSQEVFPEYIKAMLRKGFVALEASCMAGRRCDQTTLPFPHCRGYTVADDGCQSDGTTRRRAELAHRNGWLFGDANLAGLSHWKFGFTGLAVFVSRGSGFLIAAHRFLRYSDSAQAGLGESMSGFMRTDGLQVVTIYDPRSGGQYIVVNTHLESYNKACRREQFHEMVKELRRLRHAHPNAIIQVAGDFNWNQDGFNLRVRKQLRAVSTSWRPEEWATYVQNDGTQNRLDGIHTLLPRSWELVAKRSRTIPSQDLSDHEFVFMHVELRPRGHT